MLIFPDPLFIVFHLVGHSSTFFPKLCSLGSDREQAKCWKLSGCHIVHWAWCFFFLSSLHSRQKRQEPEYHPATVANVQPTQSELISCVGRGGIWRAELLKWHHCIVRGEVYNLIDSTGAGALQTQKELLWKDKGVRAAPGLHGVLKNEIVS